MQNTNTAKTHISENEYVAELLAILKANNSPGLKEFNALLGQVSDIKRQLDTAVQELAQMRKELAEAEKRSHPIRNALRKAVIVMQARVIELRDKFSELKEAVVKGCKNAVAAFREKGGAALNNIARFFKVKPILEAIQAAAEKAEKNAQQAVTNIEAAGARYHEAGKHLKNVGRALSGRETVTEIKPNGKALKAITAPFHTVRSCFKGVARGAAAAARCFARMEEKTKPRKPPVKETLQKYNYKITQENRGVPKKKSARSSPEL